MHHRISIALRKLRQDLAHRMGLVGDVHHHLEKGDVLVGDRGFCSFLHLAMLAARSVHAVIRVHARQIVDFNSHRSHVARRSKGSAKGLPRSRWLRRLDEQDQVVEWFKPLTRPKWLTEAQFDELPDSLELREVRYEIGRQGYRTRSITLVTTLLDAKAYPLTSLSDLYGLRWSVELNLRHLKQTMKMDVLRCKTVDGVLKELTVYALVYNRVRAVMLKAASTQGEAADRISFVDPLWWLAGAEEDLSELVVNPDRPGRVQPRVVKRRPKEYVRMTKSQSEWRKQLLGQEIAA
ncbi:transposase [Singulisphaera sp. PoT]|uniref:transposase n=1 Tax=Singulisphaera sp. PoT TaxID=3411797 RepID=UPI003BF4F185